MIKRIFDFFVALVLSILFMPLALAIAILIKVTSHGPVIFWSNRIGQFNKIFKMPKFRTMKLETPSVATHLISNPNQYLTPIGSFLRKSSLDEIPQLWSILVGDMSFVGPRPALFNQKDLVELRTSLGVHKIKPGLTGWAQINGRDSLSIPEKVQWEKDYLEKRSFWFDIYIFISTIERVLFSKNINH